MANDTNDRLEIETAALVHGAPRRVKLHGFQSARQAFNLQADNRAEINHAAKDWSSWFRGLLPTQRGPVTPPPVELPEIEFRCNP